MPCHPPETDPGEAVLGQLLRRLYAESDAIFVHRLVLPVSLQGGREEGCAVSVLGRDGRRRDTEAPTLAGCLRALLVAPGEALTRHCGCAGHEGPRDVPAAAFSPGDRWCRACRARLEAERRALRRAGRLAPGAGAPPSGPENTD